MTVMNENTKIAFKCIIDEEIGNPMTVGRGGTWFVLEKLIVAVSHRTERQQRCKTIEGTTASRDAVAWLELVQTRLSLAH